MNKKIECKIENGPVFGKPFLVKYEDGVIMYMEELEE